MSDNLVVRRSIAQARDRVLTGTSLHESFAQEQLFPSLVLRMLKVGESTGELDVALSNISYLYSRDTSIKVWSYENLKKITLVHSFGGHGGSITLVKFWPLAFYKQCLVNLALQNEEEPTEDEG